MLAKSTNADAMVNTDGTPVDVLPVDAPLENLPIVGATDYSQSEFDAIKRRETLSLKSYWDFKGYSIGYGHFITPADGVGDGKTWTIDTAKAEQLLAADIEKAAQAVRDAITVPISQNQFDACVDLAYNIGAKAFSNSTLVKRINAGDPSAGQSFLDWVKVTIDGVKTTSKALLARREENLATFNA